MSEQVIIDGELSLDSAFDGLPSEQIIVNVTGAPKIIDKASGKSVSIVDGAENERLLSAVVNIEPVQDLHGYDSPWLGGCGKNLVDTAGRTTTTSSGQEDYTHIYTEHCTGVINGDAVTATITGVWSKLRYMFDTSKLTNGQTYTFSALFSNPDAQTLMIGYNNGSWHTSTSSTATSVRLSVTFTFSSSWTSLILGCMVNNTAQNTGKQVVVKEVQLEVGSSATSYAPYENICPISGLTGLSVYRTVVNVWDEVWELGNINDQTGQNINANNVIRSKNYIPAVGNNDYYYCFPSAARMSIYYYDENKNYIFNYGGSEPYVRTTPSNCRYIRFRMNSVYGTTYNNDISINYPATDTDYHAYDGSTYVVDWTSEAGTVYGGTLDVVRGKCEKKLGAYDMGTLSWSYANGRFFAIVTGMKSITSQTEVAANSLCSMFKATGKEYSSLVDGELTTNNANFSSSPYVIVKNSQYTDAASFKTAVTGQTLVYELATPLEYDVTPQTIKTLLGTNNIWADAGSMEVEYVADTKLYIQRLTAPTEDDMIANDNIASGKFFMVGNDLYLSTAAIVAGETIAPGTNCTKLSLAEALNNINA